MSTKWELGFGNFSAFFELRTSFGAFLGTVVKNVEPGIDRNFVICQEILASIFGSLKCVSPKCTFLGPQLNQLGLVLVNPLT